jgi:5'-nucleotidase
MRMGWVVLAAGALAIGGCGGDDDDASPATTATTAVEATVTTGASEATTTTAAADPLVVLVGNDDGVGAAGIDALVEALRAERGVVVVVSAPADNQSGSGDATTPGGAAAHDATTASGYPATAVEGEPADGIVYGLDVLLADDPPDLVVAGINEGQNLGPIVGISGTVGAARTAARRGIPAVAVSQGLPPADTTISYEDSVAAFIDWFEANRDELVAGSVVNINVPTCTVGLEPRGTVETVTAADTVSGNPVEPGDCASTATDPVDDIAAFRAGFVAVADPGLG